MFDIRDHGGNLGGGISGKLNIYTQLTEPTKKEGIWIKTDKQHSKVINDLQLWFANSWNDLTLLQLASLPMAGLDYPVTVSVGDYIYVIGSSDTTKGKYLYRYSVSLDSWTRLTDAPGQIYGGFATYFNGLLYVQSSSTGKFYTYNIATDTWSTLPTAFSSVYATAFTRVGTFIYAVSTAGALMKYDLELHTFTQLRSAQSVNKFHALMCYANNKLYIFGGGDVNTSTVSVNLEIYDISSDTWSYGANTPIQFSSNSTVAQSKKGVCISINDLPIVFYGSKKYIYNPSTNTWSSETSTFPYDFTQNGSWDFSGGNLYVANASSSTYGLAKYSLTSKQYDDGTCILYRTSSNGIIGGYITELVTLPNTIFSGVNTRLASYFDNVYFYQDGALKPDLPTYYGNGTQWIQFKGA